MKKIILFLFICLLASMLTAQAKVLIVSSGGSFKEELVTQTITKLAPYKLEITSENLKFLKTITAKDYKAIIIVNSIWARKMNKYVSRFLAKASDEVKAKVILIDTAGSKKWESKQKGLLAITSASKKEEIDPISKQIVEKVTELIE